MDDPKTSSKKASSAVSRSGHDDDDLNDSTNYDVGSTSSATEYFQPEAEREKSDEILARREKIAVVGLRTLVFVVLLLSMVFVAIGVYFYVANSEYSQFETQFEEVSFKVLQSIGSAVDLTLGGVDALVVNLVSYTSYENQSWPFVYVPDFAVRAEKTRALTKAVYLCLYPYVKDNATRYEWQKFASIYGPKWVADGLDLQEREGLYLDVFDRLNITNDTINYWNVMYDYGEFDKNYSEQGTVGLSPDDPGPFMPLWDISPLIPVYGSPYGFDLLSLEQNESMVAVLETHLVTLSEAYLIAYENDTQTLEYNIDEANFLDNYLTTGEDPMEPVSDILYPVMDDANEWIWQHNNNNDGSDRFQNYNASQHKLNGFLSITFYWRDLIKGILPVGNNGIIVVFSNPCNPTFSYQIDGPNVKFLGVGDFHEPQFRDLMIESDLSKLGEFREEGQSTYTGIPLNPNICPHTVRVYPSTIMLRLFVTNNRIIFTVGAVLIFALTSAVFLLYDCWVERRQKVVMTSAIRTNEIVASFFPSTVRDRIFQHQEEKKMKDANNSADFKKNTWKSQSNKASSSPDLPIADFFPETTILFADLAGFTAWSSQREPAQVFILLETLYESFDKIAKRRGVFKIETIGDCYVAVVGLPTPRKNHAVVMARFAADMRDAMNEITPGLELKLGPGTGDLLIRIGLHSGSCTGGVLRGEKCLFTLFGDTVNTASRMESNGQPNRIHCSQATADLLIEAGKDEWLSRREDLITAKGKGKMQTYWVNPRKAASTQSSDLDESGTNIFSESLAMIRAEPENTSSAAAKLERSVDWNVAIFEELLKRLIAKRNALGVSTSGPIEVSLDNIGGRITSSRDEVSDVLHVESHDIPALEGDSCLNSITLAPEVADQLYSYISVIAHSYRLNSFHGYKRATHNSMFIKTLYQRITTSKSMSREDILVRSFGGNSDPLAQFAILFAVLISDVDHPGIPNAFLIREDPTLSAQYRYRSISEQHSVDVAWSLLMEPLFDDLRACLFATHGDIRRFRQVVVNCVLATDLFDRELNSDRGRRWERGFNESGRVENEEIRDLQATTILEHVILATDVSHTFQPWSIYTTWSRCLFEEMYSAFLAGRINRDPALYWYEGELRFFDFYVIPIAAKLSDCAIFGAGSRELLDNVEANRAEWEAKGREIVEQMKESFAKIDCVEI